MAWRAHKAMPDALDMLDLGSGVGAIGLMALVRMAPEARLTGVEVQAISVALARKTLAFNDLEHRVSLRHGDLRDPASLALEERFALITGNPPYLPEGSATPSPYPQRHNARIEMHGDVFDYCRCAAAHLAPEGRFVFCHAASDKRPELAIEATGLALLERRDVRFRADCKPTISLFTCAHEGARHDAPDILVRTPGGAWTAQYEAIRREMLIA